jgi:hypothetical protein
VSRQIVAGVAWAVLAVASGCRGVGTSGADVRPESPATPIAPATPAPAPPEPAAPPAAEPFPADCSVTPPSAAHLEILGASPSDHAPEVLDAVTADKVGTHYYISDEEHPERFREHVTELGGGYIGIGSDQAYLYIGWARPQFAWTVDYDPEIVRTHRLHQAFIAASETPSAYKALWSDAHRDAASAIVDQIPTDDAERAHLHRILRKIGPRMRYRFSKLRKSLRGVPSFLTDQPTFDFVRGLVRNGCVRPMLVDLLQTDGLRGIADAAAEVALPVRTVYLSNAEEYWDYTDEFRANIRGLPRDERSVVLHTQSSRINRDYRYTVQSLDNFVAWLDAGWARNVDRMLGRPPIAGPTDFPIRRFDVSPDAAREKHARRAKRR